MQAGSIYLSSDNDVFLRKLTDSGAAITSGATVTFTLLNSAGAAVVSNVVMAPFGSDGTWKGRIEDSVAATLKRRDYYKVVVTIDYGDTHIEVEREMQAVPYQGG